MVFSTEVSAVKPTPKIFKKTLELFAVSADQTLFVGDSYRYDVAGSQRVGMDAV
ncbi:HAD family hydrolase [bacterium]|nr:HAD family hydrolase [bacterium]